MKKVDVFYDGWGEHWHLGTLAESGRTILFEYSATALSQRLELSPHKLPLRAGAHGGFPAYLLGLPGLISDALPDGWGMLLMDKLLRKQGVRPHEVSALDRLLFIGQRAMGALSFAPAMDLPVPQESLDLMALALEAQQVMAGDEGQALKHLALIGGSPHGARPKALVYRNDAGHISTLPFEGAQAWLFKFPAEREHKEVCAIEALYVDMARRCGLEVPHTLQVDLGARLAAFGTQRFDVEAGMRVPVHTLAGALHADFRMPCVDAETFLALTRKLTRDEREVRKAFCRVVFNVVFHNRDDHAKNFSFRLGRDRRWYLSPAYDLTFCGGPGGEHQMDVFGEGRHITRAHLARLAQACDLDAVWSMSMLDEMLAHAAQWAHEAAQRDIRKATVKDIGKAIAGNLAGLTKPG